MWWFITALVVIGLLGLVLRRRGATKSGNGQEGLHDSTRPPESFRIPGSGGGNNGGFTI
ncbi:MAG: hypothetical protein ABIQ13_05955 [Pedococcus sp.]